MTELEMIAEWRKGCSCASKEHPEECTACTRGLVDALEAKLRAATPPAAKGTTEGYKATFRDGEFEQVCAALAQQPAAQAAGLTDEGIIDIAELDGVATYETGWYRMTRSGLLAFARALLSRAAPSGEPVAYVECRECGRCGHTGINDAHSQDECCSNCDWTGPAPKEDVCPGCAQTGTMRAACPKCGSVYRLLCETTVGAATQPSAQQAEQPAEEARGLDAHTHAKIVANCLMAAKQILGDHWNGACDDALTHADTLVALLASPAAGAGQDKPVATVRVTHTGYGMELSAYIAYALPEGKHDLYAKPQAATGAQGLDDVLAELDWCIGNGCYGPRTEKVLQRVRAILAQAAPCAGACDVLPWVSVKDRLPPYGESVLLYRPKAFKTHDSIFRIAHRIEGARGPYEFRCVAEPTHWMPIAGPAALAASKEA